MKRKLTPEVVGVLPALCPVPALEQLLPSSIKGVTAPGGESVRSQQRLRQKGAELVVPGTKSRAYTDVCVKGKQEGLHKVKKKLALLAPESWPLCGCR